MLARERLQISERAKMVEETLRQAGLKQRLLDASEQSLLERPQRSDEIAAIDRRNEPRRQRLESARVIPVEDMTVMFRNTGERGYRALRLGHKFGDGEVAKLAGDLLRVEKQSEIGRRDTGCDRRRLFLNVVGNQPVMLFGAEFRVVAPGVKSRIAQEQDFFSRQFLAGNPGGAIQPDGYEFTARPQRKYGQSDDQGRGLDPPHKSTDRDGKNGNPVEVTIRRSQACGEFGFGSGFPFEKALASKRLANDRADHRVEREQGLVSEESQRERRCDDRGQEGVYRVASYASFVFDNRLDDTKNYLENGRQKEQENCGDGPANGGSAGSEPAKNEKNESPGFDQAAAQVVENLPARNQRDGIRNTSTGFVRHVRKKPSSNLPIAAQPAMLAAVIGTVVRGIIFDDFDVTGQSSARIGTFDQIVAEQCVAREALIKNLMDRVDLVNSLPGKAAFAIQILVGIGDSSSVNVEPGLAGIDGSETRTNSAEDAHADARLQDAVASDDDILVRIDDRLIQRMRERSHHAVRRSARKLSIGIECDDEPNFGENREVANFDRKAVVFRTQKFVQVHQLAALALPTHPAFLARVVDAMAMQQKERPLLFPRVLLVKFLNERRTQLDQGILFAGAVIGVREV